jgi:hypothetical protein
MQAAGLTHGDAHLHNFVACPSPLEVLPIDFELALLKAQTDEQEWLRRCEADRVHLLKLGVFLQCALGRQHGPLGLESMSKLATLVQPEDSFQRVIAERTFDSSIS